METFSALLTLCTGNTPLTGKFPAQRPVTRSFDVFLDLRLDKRFGKQWWGWWFKTPSCSLWRHCNDFNDSITTWLHAVPPNSCGSFGNCGLSAALSVTLRFDIEDVITTRDLPCNIFWRFITLIYPLSLVTRDIILFYMVKSNLRLYMDGWEPWLVMNRTTATPTSRKYERGFRTRMAYFSHHNQKQLIIYLKHVCCLAALAVYNGCLPWQCADNEWNIVCL